MAELTSRALLIALPPAELTALGPVLQKARVAVESVVDTDPALERLTTTPFDLLIAVFPVAPLGVSRLVSRLRHPGAASRRAGFILLARPEELQEARGWVGRGVNKVLSTHEHAEVLQVVVARLLDVTSPTAERIAARLDIRCSIDNIWRRLHTENVSATGVLVSTSEEVMVGLRFRFELVVPNVERPVAGEAKVVRRTVLGRETATGFGARFCSFDGNGRQVLLAYLKRLRA